MLAISLTTATMPLIPTVLYISPASYLTLAASVVFPSPARSCARHYFPFLSARATHARAPWTPRVPALTHQPARHSRVPQPTLRARQPTRVPHATARALAAGLLYPSHGRASLVPNLLAQLTSLHSPTLAYTRLP